MGILDVRIYLSDLVPAIRISQIFQQLLRGALYCLLVDYYWDIHLIQ